MGSEIIRFWDLGGAESLHKIWQNYYSESDAVIFVIDGKSWERMGQAKDCFAKVADNSKLEGVPMMILVNKQDLVDDDELAAKIKELFNPMIADLGAREAKIAACSALKGYIYICCLLDSDYFMFL